MAKIYKDSTDQYILFRATATDYTAFTGASDGDALPGAILIISEYKKADEVIETPVITWNATVGKWKATIPAENITQYGTGELNISGTGMVSVSIEFDVVFTPDYSQEIIEGTLTRIEIERLIAAVLCGDETRTTGSSTFIGLDGSTPRVVASLSLAGRNVTSLDGGE